MLHDEAPQVIRHPVGVPPGPRQQVLHPVRRGIPGLLRDRPAVLARQRQPAGPARTPAPGAAAPPCGNAGPVRSISSSSNPSHRAGSTLWPAATARSSCVVTNQDDQRWPSLPQHRHTSARETGGAGGRRHLTLADVETTAAFRLSGNATLTAAAVTRRRGIQPTSALEAGDPVSSRSAATRQGSLWLLTSSPGIETGTEIAGHLHRLLAILEPPTAALWELAHAGRRRQLALLHRLTRHRARSRTRPPDHAARPHPPRRPLARRLRRRYRPLSRQITIYGWRTSEAPPLTAEICGSAGVSLRVGSS